MTVTFFDDAQDNHHAAVAALDNIYVSHQGMVQAIEGILECISWSDHSKEPKGALVTGEGGAGKTTICQVILKRFPPATVTIDDALVNTVPAFYSSVPSPCSIKSLASNMLEQLGDPAPGKGTAYSLTNRLCKLLVECKTKVIILDELHNLVPTKGRAQSRAGDVCDWIRSLMNNAKVMICLVGTPSCESILQESDGQMSRRFAHRYRLNDLSCGTATKPGELTGFLQHLTAEYAAKLVFTGMPDFSSHDLSGKMWAATAGRPAFITLLLQKAALYVLAAGRTSLTVDDLAHAFDSGITLDVAKTKKNPFHMSAYELGGAVLAFREAA